MPDVLGPLRELGGAALREREPIEALRARAARRRRRQRFVYAPVLVTALLGVGALVAAVRDDSGGAPHAVHTVDDPDATSTSTSTTVSSSVPTGAPNPLAGVRRVVSGSAGVVVLDPAANPPARRLTDEPTLIAFGVGDGLVVAQHDDLASGRPGPIVVFDGTVERELVEAPTEGLWLDLLDGRFVGGRPLALVASSSGLDPETHEVHLSKVDLETGDSTDLGVVGGWEEGVDAGQLLSDGDVVFQRSWIMGGNLERRSPTGAVVWTSDALGADGEDHNRTMVVHDAALLVLDQLDVARFEVRRFDLATGDEGASTELTVSGGEDIGTIDGVCSDAHSAPGGLLCERSYEGGPVLVDLASGHAQAIPDAAPERGSAMTVWRDAPGR